MKVNITMAATLRHPRAKMVPAWTITNTATLCARVCSRWRVSTCRASLLCHLWESVPQLELGGRWSSYWQFLEQFITTAPSFGAVLIDDFAARVVLALSVDALALQSLFQQQAIAVFTTMCIRQMPTNLASAVELFFALTARPQLMLGGRYLRLEPPRRPSSTQPSLRLTDSPLNLCL